MSARAGERRLAAIVSADVAGYSRLMGADEAGTLARLKRHRKELIEPLIAAQGGRVVKLMGDGILIEFPSAVHALACSIAVQQGMAERNAGVPADARIEFRVGINVGDIIVEGDDIFGDGVNVAARLQSIAEPGSIYVSADVQRYVGARLGISLEDCGLRTLKNIAEPVHVWRWAGVVGAAPVAPSPAPAAARDGAAERPSIAVLPFNNMSADPEQEYFVDGITEDIITDLSKVAGLLVIARNSAFTYKGRAVRIDEVCRELGVRYAVEGSVRRAGNRVRITAQLIEGATGGHLWAERYDRELDDIFAVQDDVTRNIVAGLKVKLSPGEERRISRHGTTSVEAYDCYLKGLELSNRFTREANAEARDFYGRSLELDPDNPVTLAALANNHLRDWTLGWSVAPEESLELARDLAAQAVARCAELPEAHAVLGFSLLWMRRHDAAIAETERAVSLGPNSSTARVYHALTLAFSDRAADGLPQAEAALRLDPKWPAAILWALGHVHFCLERYEAARGALESAVAVNPNFLPSRAFLAATYVALGLEERARTEIAAARRLNPDADLAWMKARLPYRGPATLERLLDLLRRAGATE